MIKIILNLLIPPIFSIVVLRELFNKIFFKSSVKKKISYEKNFYKRHAFINKAISKFKNCKYLEIGVDNNDVFNSIPLKISNKFGVDPVKGGNFRMTSDEFFKKNKNLKFDVIFIDGLHTYEQCQKDCINAMNSLKKNGVIFFHDMLPRSDFEERVPRRQLSWTGDVWKVALELLKSKNVNFKICNIDMGIGVLKLKKNYEYKKLNDIKKLYYKDFLKFYKKFNIINSEEALKFIEKN